MMAGMPRPGSPIKTSQASWNATSLLALLQLPCPSSAASPPRCGCRPAASAEHRSRRGRRRAAAPTTPAPAATAGSPPRSWWRDARFPPRLAMQARKAVQRPKRSLSNGSDTSPCERYSASRSCLDGWKSTRSMRRPEARSRGAKRLAGAASTNVSARPNARRARPARAGVDHRLLQRRIGVERIVVLRFVVLIVHPAGLPVHARRSGWLRRLAAALKWTFA